MNFTGDDSLAFDHNSWSENKGCATTHKPSLHHKIDHADDNNAAAKDRNTFTVRKGVLY